MYIFLLVGKVFLDRKYFDKYFGDENDLLFHSNEKDGLDEICNNNLSETDRGELKKSK